MSPSAAVCLVVLALIGAIGAARAAQPAVTVDYSPSLDAACSALRGGSIKDEWKEELSARKPEFDALWARLGPRFIDAAEGLTGKSFPTGAITARLTLCNVPSQSFAGVLVNMRFALKSFVPAPVPLRYKVDTLFHELLHVHLSGFSSAGSALLAQHAAEPECTRNHLHLLALQKAVLLKLQEGAALADVIAVDGQLPGGCYKRAWAIVNASETEYLKYVAELAR